MYAVYIYIYISTYKYTYIYICTSSYIYVHMGSYIIWGLSIVNFGCFSRWDYVAQALGFPIEHGRFFDDLGPRAPYGTVPESGWVDLVQRKSVFNTPDLGERCQFRGLNQEALLLAAGFNMVE